MKAATSMASRLKVVLDVVWYLGAVSVGLFAVLLVLSLFVDTTRLSAFSVEVGWAGLDVGKPSEIPGQNVAMVLPIALDAERVAPLTPQSGEAQIEHVRADLRFPVPSRRFFSVSLAIMLAQMALGLWVLTQLRDIFRAVCDGEPFANANSARIQRVGLGVILAEFVQAGAVFFWSYSSTALFPSDGARFAPMVDVSVATIVCGLILLVIAEVFREGSRLREEQSLTI